jgi:hypothetical protein
MKDKINRTCACCGKDVEGIPRFFMSHVPKAFVTNRDSLVFDKEYMCRSNDGRYFVRCEIELPLRNSNEEPLGFIEWVQVSEATYSSYLAYRENEETLAPYEELVSGNLASLLLDIPGAFVVAVKFKVLPNDPTPYIRWAQPGSSLASYIEQGVTQEFWHQFVSRL